MSERIKIRDVYKPEVKNGPLLRPIRNSDYPALGSVLELAKLREIPNAGLDTTNPDHIRNIQKIIADVHAQMFYFDQTAQKPFELPETVSPEDYGLIVRLSNPGTYFAEFKDGDKGKFGPWGNTLDRQADDAAVITAMQLATRRDTLDISPLHERRMFTGYDHIDVSKVKNGIQSLQIPFFYAGLPEETEAIEKVLHSKSSYINRDQVVLIAQEKGNTITQLEALKETCATVDPSKRILLVGFAPHITRALWLAQAHNIFTDGKSVDLALLPTPALGLEQPTQTEFPSMVMQEIKATLYYALTGKAAYPNIPITSLGNPWLTR